MSLGGVAAPAYSISQIVKLKKRQKKAKPQAITEVSSWLQESYGLKVPDYIALELAENMSVADRNSRTWAWRFNDWTDKPYILRCNPEGLFYIENNDGQKTLTEVSESLTENVKSIATHAASSAIAKENAQLLENIQNKANSLLASDTSVETKIAVQQLTTEALKAVELNEKLTKLNPTSNSSNLNSILGLLDTELDDVLSEEVTQVEREMERQNMYVQSRQQSKPASKLKLNS